MKSLFERMKTGGLLFLGMCAMSLGAAGCGKGTVWSTKDEINIGKQASKEVEHQFRVDETSEDAKRVKRVGERLIAHTDVRPGVPYSFKVLDSKEVNAVSLPGGPIYVFRGLLDLIGDDDDELATVIGHEIGHINGRHIAHQYTKQLQAGLLLGLILSGQSSTVQNVAGIGQELIGLKYSRDDEYEADRRGLSYAYKAGFDAQGMVRFFKKLQALEVKPSPTGVGGGGGGPEFLKTHPVTKTRIDKALKLIEGKEYKYGE